MVQFLSATDSVLPAANHRSNSDFVSCNCYITDDDSKAVKKIAEIEQGMVELLSAKKR